MLSRPAFRSRLSCARRTRTSFARWSASILWSSERAGACACVFVVTMSRTSLPRLRSRSSRTVLADLQGFLSLSNLDYASARIAERASLRREARRRCALLVPARPPRAPRGSGLGARRIREEHRAERDRSSRPLPRGRARRLPVPTPPMPTIGRSTASAHACTHASAIGRSAGPEYPPAPRASFGRRVSGSSARPRIVLTSDSPSAPAAATARADSAMSHVAGESFAYSGLRRDGARRGDELGGRLGRLLDVRAREVELDRRDRVASRRAARRRARSRSPRSRRRTPRAGRRGRASRGRFSSHERVDAGVLEADRVEHPVVGLRDAAAAGFPRAAAA